MNNKFTLILINFKKFLKRLNLDFFYVIHKKKFEND